MDWYQGLVPMLGTKPFPQPPTTKTNYFPKKIKENNSQMNQFLKAFFTGNFVHLIDFLDLKGLEYT